MSSAIQVHQQRHWLKAALNSANSLHFLSFAVSTLPQPIITIAIYRLSWFLDLTYCVSLGSLFLLPIRSHRFLLLFYFHFSHLQKCAISMEKKSPLERCFYAYWSGALVILREADNNKDRFYANDADEFIGARLGLCDWEWKKWDIDWLGFELSMVCRWIYYLKI